VPVSTVYGEETSSIHPGRDTLRFFKLMLRYWGRRLAGGKGRVKAQVAARRDFPLAASGEAD
jgi:hypothetical protein